ncbi:MULTISPECIES: hypothetical protein [Rhodomicrobium]|uniref:hypothetical protein n=1 Tax=Rhodomicrobium TaxID=1068 RepID=UPI000B4C071A|nr:MULTISPECIES: hypothetical protein [Rhodomicrobium]
MTASKPEFKAFSPFKVPTEAVEDFAKEHNIPSTVFPKKNKPTLVKAPQPTGPSAKFGFHIPEDVAHRLKQRALDDRCTVRAVVLKAMAQYGIEVAPEDIVDDGRRKNRNAL